ncbi:MAG: alpha/beta hydrolase [Syntrophales bacterium]
MNEKPKNNMECLRSFSGGRKRKRAFCGIVDLGTLKAIFIPIVSVMSLIGCNLQYSMLYYPDTSVPSPAELTARHLRFWPSGPDGYRGFIGTDEIKKNSKGTIIVFHGNAGTAADRLYYVDALGSIGYRVILAEYPGYGKREGALGEESLVRDAKATVRLASERYGAPLFLLGESLGCGVAAGAAVDAALRIDGLLLITPWDTLIAVAKSHFRYLPVGLFMRDRYDNSENLKAFRGRIAVVGAELDDIVPIRHARKLYRSLPGPKRMWTIKGAGHSDWPMVVDLPKWRKFMDFVAGDLDIRPRMNDDAIKSMHH